jgi:hypothetical protein
LRGVVKAHLGVARKHGHARFEGVRQLDETRHGAATRAGMFVIDRTPAFN